jgi:HSP20 family protein
MFDPFQQLRSEFDRQLGGVWDNLASVAPRFAASRVFPGVNVWQEGDNLYAEAEVPGVKSQDIDISVVGNELIIKGQRNDAGPEEGCHRRERRVGNFTRVIRLPVEIDGNQAQAAFKDGVLLVTLPKHENAKPRKITVSVS